MRYPRRDAGRTGQKLAEALNEHVLNMFVGVGEKST
jgi:hypothetical protein